MTDATAKRRISAIALLAFGSSFSVCTLARAQALQQEKSHVHEQLASQRAALALMHGQESQVAEAIGLVQSLAQAARQRTTALTAESKAVERRLAIAEEQDAQARELLGAQLVHLGPRLAVLYRLTRHSRLDLMLSAPDLAQTFWRAWTLKKLLRADLALLEETQLVARYQDRVRRRLERTREQVLGEREALAEANQRERDHALELKDTFAWLQAKARASRQSLKDLERTDNELGALIRQLERLPDSSGLGMMRGKLPMPVSGLVEVGFGRIVNPKFNTAVDHKGLDIRAANGMPVHAVAEGKVVWTGWLRGYGNLLIVEHGGGYHTLMAHLGSFSHHVGDSVQAGEELATVGDSGSLKGPYLYFELRVRGLAVDPRLWLNGS